MTKTVLEVSLFLVPLEDMLTELDEVILRPYNLSGELDRDMNNMDIDIIIAATTLDLPNANLKPRTQSQRKLYAARTWDAHFYVIAFTSRLDPLFNYFSGRTKMLNKRIAREEQSKWIENVRKFYADSLYINDLKISKAQISDFIYFCEQDSLFRPVVETDDKLKLWEFLSEKSSEYIEINEKF